MRDGRLAVSDWLSEVVPDWLTEVMRPKKAPVPWADMIRAVLAIWAPLAAGLITGRRELGLLPAMGGLLSILIDTGGPYLQRVRRVGTAAVFGGAAGLVVGMLIHGRGWVAVAALVVIAGVSAIVTRLGATGSATGLQLLGPFGLLRPWWHTVAEFVAGAVWALALITPSWLLSPRAAEQRAVAAVYHALADALRAIGTPSIVDARGSATTAPPGPGTPTPWRSKLRLQASRSLSDLRAEFQRTMSELPAISRRALAWWPAVVGIEDVLDAATTIVVAISRGAPVPAPDAVHKLTGTLRAVADAIKKGVPPPSPGDLPSDPALQQVTAAVRSVLAVLARDEPRARGEAREPAPA